MGIAPELVVLVNEQNEPIGTALKADVHTDRTPLHRGFSVFVFHPKGELLLQQRARTKKTWPLVWSNSCCGHPAPGEETVDAAKRRLMDELSVDAGDVKVLLPNYRYSSERDGVVENEMCPVLVARYSGAVVPDPDEVENTTWMPWNDFLKKISSGDGSFSPWCIEEARLLDSSQEFRRWMSADQRGSSG
ncbi:MAG: isopentenyl-diphosphate Delta-isomerase [Candidatus Kerfeldbacteria bacterium]